MVTPSVDTSRAEFDLVGHKCDFKFHLLKPNSTFCQVGDVLLQNLEGLQGDDNERMCIEHTL